MKYVILVKYFYFLWESVKDKKQLKAGILYELLFYS